MPTTTQTTTEEEGYETLKAHLNEDGLTNLRKSLQLYIRFAEGKKAARRTKPDIDLTKHKVKTGVQEKVEIGDKDPNVDNMYSRHIKYVEDKQQYVVTYLYGKANLNGNVLAHGKQYTWVVSAKKKAIWKALESDFVDALNPISISAIKENVSKLASGIKKIDTTYRAIAAYGAVAGTIFSASLMMNF